MAPEDSSRAIGIDVGGTKILGVVAGSSGRVEHRIMTSTPSGADGVRAAIVEVADELIAAAAAGPGLAEGRDRPIRGVGVGVPGLVDRTGVLRYGPNLPGVVGLDIGRDLRARTDLRVVVENDASLAAVAEHRAGAARGHDHAIVITQGTGIGGGIIVNGSLLRGANGFAGEPGHIVIDPSGPVCACGTQGCWEAFASGTGLANLARKRIAEGGGAVMLSLAGGNPDHLTGLHVAEALAADDPEAIDLVAEFARLVAVGLSGLIAVFDPSIVVLGGGLRALSDRFIPDVRNYIDDVVLGAGHRPTVALEPTQLGADAGAIGGALLAIEPDPDRA